MPLSNPDLWRRLVDFEFDEPNVSFSFSRRLARDCGWLHEYALRVVEEYRRFLYLAFAAGHHVTPSVDVDEAWHLHLTYSRSYWERLCGATIGAPLHHDPTRGGAVEGSKFDDWYSRTLESYEREFGEPSPADIWPSRTERFDPALQPMRVTRRTHFVVSRSRMLAALPFVGLVAVFGAILAPIAGCGSRRDGVDPGVWIVIAGILIVLFAWNQSRGRRRNRRRAGTGSAHDASAVGMYWAGSPAADGGDGDGDGASGSDFGGGDAGGADSTGADGGSGCGGSGCGGGGD